MIAAQCKFARDVEIVNYRAETPAEAVLHFWDAASAGSEEQALGIVSPPSDSFLRMCGKENLSTHNDLPITRLPNEQTIEEFPVEKVDSLLSAEKGYDFTLASHFRYLGTVKDPRHFLEITEISTFEDESVITAQARLSKAPHTKHYYFLWKTISGWKVIGVSTDAERFLLINPGYGTPQSCRN